MKNSKINHKIMIGFAIATLFGWLLGGLGFLGTTVLGSSAVEQNKLQASYMEASHVLNAHFTWRYSLFNAVSVGEEFTGSVDPTTCALGKWLGSDSSKSDDPQLQELFAAVMAPHNAIHQDAHTINELLAEGKQQEALELYTSSVSPNAEKTIGYIGQIEDRYGALLDENMSQMIFVKKVSQIVILVGFLLSAICNFALASIILKSIMNPLRRLSEASRQLALGNLEMEISYPVDDEIGQLTNSVKRLIESMKKQEEILSSYAKGNYAENVAARSEKDKVNFALIDLKNQTSRTLGDIRQSANLVSSSSQQMAHTSQTLATSSTQQAATLQELSDNIASIQNAAEENSETASLATTDSAEVKNKMSQSLQAMEKMVQAMQNIDESSTQINKIIQVIDDLAFQTNILALNAAVEAARAGQHGKGFAVVADEVRNLASKSTQAANETSQLILKSGESVEDGNRVVETVNQFLQQADDLIDSNEQLVRKINEASHLQQQSLAEVSLGVAQLNDVAQSNSAAAEESAALAQEMSAQALVMNQSIAHFNFDVNNALQPSPNNLIGQ